MKRIGSLLSMVLLLAVFVVGCGGAPSSSADSSSAAQSQDSAPTEIVVTHQLGETRVPVNPQRVAVFDMGILDTLDALGIPVAGVPKDGLPDYLSKYNDDKYANIGTLKEPDLEALSALNPDLIIISGRQSTFYNQLKELAPTIYLGVDTANYMDSFKENMEYVGAIFQKEEEVAARVNEIDELAAQVKEKAAQAGGKALVVLSNDKSISAFGAGSRFGLIHDVLGFPPVDESIQVTTHGASVSFEFIKEKNPDYIFVIDRASVVSSEGGSQSARETFDNDLVKATSAHKNGKIIYLDANYWYLSGGGLTSVREMIQEAAASVQ